MKRTEILSHIIQYREVGDGPTVILVHGYGGTIYDWDEVADNLSKNFRVIVPNLSSIYMDPHRPLSFSQQVTIFKEFIKLFKKNPKDIVYLAGGSYGAALCYALAIEDGNLIDRIALLNPMPPHPKEMIRNKLIKTLVETARFAPSIRMLLMSPAGKIALKYIQKFFSVPWVKSAANKNRLSRVSSRKAKLITHVVHRFWWINSVEDWSIWESRLAYIKVPVHLLWGDRDNLFIDNTYVRLSEIFPACQVTRIEGARHILMKERPEEVTKVLNKFFSSQEQQLNKVIYNQ